MREAGQAVAIVHQRIAEAIAPGRDHQDSTTSPATRSRRSAPESLFLGHLGFTGRDLRVGQRGDRPRHPRQAGSAATATSSRSTSARSSTAITAIRPGPTRSAISPTKRRDLLETPRTSLYDGIAQARAGKRLGAIGHAVERIRAQPRIRPGPRVRRSRHRPADVGGPHVPNHGDPKRGRLLRPG